MYTRGWKVIYVVKRRVFSLPIFNCYLVTLKKYQQLAHYLVLFANKPYKLFDINMKLRWDYHLRLQTVQISLWIWTLVRTSKVCQMRIELMTRKTSSHVNIKITTSLLFSHLMVCDLLKKQKSDKPSIELASYSSLKLDIKS